VSDLQQRLQATLGTGYRVERELGGGGMSRVFVVEEIELGRRVVVKVLPPELAAALSTERFKREIQLAAQLQHPHIVPLLTAGAKDGLLFYSMPLIEGEAVRARLIRQRELPIPEVVRILRDVVDALAYAHEHGVVHRDIKPDNILMSGHHALVTDFGVSKALSTATGESNLTSVGVALGTPAYMSPEQAAAEPQIDHRSDIYSVGAVAYELLTGRPPFAGMGPQQVLSAHITTAPEPVTRHRETVSPALAQLVMRCLEKRPADRWQSANDLLTELEALATPSGGMTPTTTLGARHRTLWPRYALSALVSVALIAGVVWWLRRAPAPYVVGNTTQVTNAPGLELDAAISPDGKFVAYAAGPLGQLHIYVKSLAGGRTVSLTDSVRGSHRLPHWTGDGTALTYIAGGTLYRVSMMGGPSEAIFESHGYEFASPVLSPDGQEIAYATADAVSVISVNGGEPRTVASGRYPNSIAWSPDGRKLAYVADNPWFVQSRLMLGNIAPSAVWIVNLDRGSQVRVTDVTHLNTAPVWTPDGFGVLYVSGSGGGRDIYQQAVTRAGAPRGGSARLTSGLSVHTISLSADGSRLTYTTFSTRSNVWSAPITRGGVTSSAAARSITNENQSVEGVGVSPDGKWLAFDSNRNGTQQHIYKVATSQGEPTQLTKDSTDDFMPSWSPDGKQIAYHSWRGGQRDIVVMSADGRDAKDITNSRNHEMYPDWSANGRQISFTSDQSGRYEIHAVARKPDGGWWAPRQITSNWGWNGRWSPDGKWIAFHRLADSVVMVVPGAGGEARVILDGHPRGLTPLASAWSDAEHVVVHAVDQNLRHAFWSVPLSGGAPKLMLRFDDPTRQPRRGEFTTDGRRLYFTIASDESDVWMMELRKP
jgi:Tol biopolymer transport system component